jgi:hypothetical protein
MILSSGTSITFATNDAVLAKIVLVRLIAMVAVLLLLLLMVVLACPQLSQHVVEFIVELSSGLVSIPFLVVLRHPARGAGKN